MTILGIETSCDETAIAIVDINNGRGLTRKNTRIDAEDFKIKVLSNVVSSQIALHAQYGGVVPMLAAREHAKNIGHVLETALKQAGIKDIGKEIGLIAVTRGPGLGPALLVGISFAKDLARKHNLPIVGTDHMRGHIYSNFLPEVGVISNSEFLISKTSFPIMNLIVSGGHTELVLMHDYEKFELIGETLDDAVGEAFDKVARLLGLGYPGGPAISQRAEKWKSEARNPKSEIGEFPRPMEHSKDYNFSFSGLKTSVLYKVRDLKAAGVELTEDVVNEICFEFQNAAVDVLIKKTIRAAKEYNVKTILLSGGVSANTLLRRNLYRATRETGLAYSQPDMAYTGDNAAMIALAGFAARQYGHAPATVESFEMDANLSFMNHES